MAQPKSYIVYNSAMVTVAGPTKQPTGATIRTMMQLKPASLIRPVAWGCSFDGAAAAQPGIVELLETDVGIAGSNITNYAPADIQPYSDVNAVPQTAGNAGGSAGFPLYLSTSGTFSSCFSIGAPTTEGAITATRMADVQLIAPTNQYIYNWSLGREFECSNTKYLRVRVTFPATVNMIAWILFEI